MVPLTQNAQILGKAAMEISLTPAARARRRFKAGRPKKTKSADLSPLSALARAVDEFEKLQRLMCEESTSLGKEIDFSDSKVGLVYCLPEKAESHTAWLPADRESIPAFGIEIMSLGALNPTFLGIVFYQFDRYAKKPEDQHVFSVLQWVTGPVAELHLRAERDKAREGTLWTASKR